MTGSMLTARIAACVSASVALFALGACSVNEVVTAEEVGRATLAPEDVDQCGIGLADDDCAPALDDPPLARAWRQEA